MTNTRNSKKTNRKILGHWTQRLDKNEMRRKFQPNSRKKLKNVCNETTQRKIQKTEIGEKLKKHVDETVVSKDINMVNTHTKTLNYIMVPKTARNSDSTRVSPESTITRQSVCTIPSHEKINNYGHGDSGANEKCNAIFFENMCVTGKKLSIWKKMKYRFMSLGSTKSVSHTHIFNSQIRSNKAKSDFDIHEKLQRCSELKHRKPFSKDYLVMHLNCQNNDRKLELPSKYFQKQGTSLKTPAREYQCTQQSSNSYEKANSKSTKYPVVNFPEIEENANKNSLTAMAIKKCLQLTEELASKICRVANNTCCGYNRNCIIGDSIAFVKSKYVKALKRVEDKYTEPCNNLKHKSQMCFAGEKGKDKHTQPNNNLKHKNQKCFAGEKVEDKYTEPYNNNSKHKYQKCLAGKEVPEKYTELCHNLKRKNQTRFIDEQFDDKYAEPCSKLKLKNQKCFAGEKVHEENTKLCNNLKHNKQKCFASEKVQHTEPRNNIKHKKQICFAGNKVEEKHSEPCHNLKHKNQISFVPEKTCNTSRNCHYISATSKRGKSHLNINGKKGCKITHDACVCSRVAKKIESNKICDNLIQKQDDKIKKNLKNKKTNSNACKAARINREKSCKDTNKNKGQSLEKEKYKNVHLKKSNKTNTDECFKSHKDCKCKIDEIKSHGIAKTNIIKQKQVLKKKNKKSNCKECLKFHNVCTCTKANKCNSSKISKTYRKIKAINNNIRKNKNTNSKQYIKFHEDCTCSKTDKFNSNKISRTCTNIISTSNNVERNKKSTKVSLIRRFFNRIPRLKSPKTQNKEDFDKTYSCHCKKGCGVRESSDYNKINRSCDQKIQKHVRVRSHSSQMIQVSKFSECAFHKNLISIAVGKSYKSFKSNVDLLNSSNNNYTTCESKRIPKSRYTQCSSCLKPGIVSTKAQCGDAYAAHNIRYTRKCYFSSERSQTIPAKHKSCIAQTSFDKNHKSCNRGCTATPQDHHYNISCPKSFPIQCDMTHMSESCTPCKFNKSKIIKRVRKKSPRPICEKKTKLKENKKYKKCQPKRSCYDSKCQATWKKKFREDMHCLLCCISKRVKNYLYDGPESNRRKIKRHTNIGYGYADCNELYLEALKYKPPLFHTSPTCKNFLNCCCMWSQCTQMMCMFAFWCPVIFMFEIFRKCFCLFWE